MSTKQKKPRFGEIADNEVFLGDYVPFSAHVSDTVIKTTTGAYCSTWKIDGIAFETTDDQDLLLRHDAFNQIVRSLGQTVSIWAHRVRRQVTDSLSTDGYQGFAKDMAERYYAGFSGHRMMTCETYLTVVYRPAIASITTNPLMRLFTHGTNRRAADIARDEAEALRLMTDIQNQISAGLKKYKAEILGTHPSGANTVSELLTFYGFLLNGCWQDVAIQRTHIKNYLPTSRLFFGGEKLEIRTPDTRIYGAMLDLKDYPGSGSFPGVLNPLLYVDYSFIETQSFSVLAKHDAKHSLEVQRGQLLATEDAAASQIDAIEIALDQLIDGQFVMGEYHYSLAVFGDSPEQTSKHIAHASQVINEAGFQAALIDVVADAAWFAQLPGNWKYRPRAANLTSRNFCGLSSLHGFGSGKRDRNPWGEAVTILKTPNGAPYYYNWHGTDENDDSLDKKAPANTTIIGMTGSGKTVLELFLVLMSMKYGPTVVFFDKDRGAEIAIRALGGNYRVLKRGIPTGFNPLWLEPNEENIRFIETLIKSLVPRQLMPSEEKALANAIRETLKMDKPIRRFSLLRQMLPIDDSGVFGYLEKWCSGSQLGWVFDNPEDLVDLTSNTLFGFDDTDFLEDPEVLGPVTMYLLHCTESLIDGRRFIYVMAEFWKRLQIPAFTDFAVNKQYTIRKQNGFGVFDTQSPAQILKSPHVAAMVEQSATQIFLPNPKADPDDYIKGFKVTKAEFEKIKTLGETSRQFLVKQGGQSTVVTLDLSHLGDALDVLSATSDNVELLDEVRLEVGDDPIVWLPVFQRRLTERREWMASRGR